MGNAASVGTTLIFELRRPGVDLDLLPLPELADSVISQAAIAAAETEETLLGWAKYSTGAQLETLVRDLRRIDDLSKPTPPRAPPRLSRRGDGRVVFSLLAGVAADRNGNDRTLVVLHTEPDNPEGTLSDGSRVDVGTRQRLECDASHITIEPGENGDQVAAGRRCSGVSERLRRQLLLRDRSCRWPGCGNTRYLHAHHVIHRGHGGLSVPENLVLLCGHHHRVLHRHGYQVTRKLDTSWLFRRPDGTVIAAKPTAMRLPRKTDHSPNLPPGTIDSKWAGERLERTQIPALPVKPRPQTQPNSQPTSRIEPQGESSAQD